MRSSLAMVFLLALVAQFVAPAHGKDWPQWRGPQRTGISAEGFLLALLLVAFNFLCLLALMAMVSVPTPNVALLVMVGFLQIAFSNVLINRKEILEFFNRPWLEPVFNFVHGVLPRTKEVSNMAAELMNNQTVASWSPLYWSAALAVAYLVVACYSLHRKAI